MIFFLIFIFAFYIYIFLKLKTPQSEKQFPDELKISVIIAAKNEEKNLPKLFSALEKQKYSFNNFEVIIIDDNSTDSTFKLANELVGYKSNFKVIKAEDKKHLGKRGALQIGIENAFFDYIAITDADCEPAKYWLKSLSNKFLEKNDFIFGISPFNQNRTLVNKIASFDNLWVHILTFSFANIGLPYSASARNFAFKKSSFIKIEGYKNTLETLSGDDDLLLREAVKHKLKIETITNKKSVVFTNSKTTFTELINQKSRHTSTSNYYSNKIKFVLGLWHLLNLFMLFSPILFFANQNIVYLLFVKIITDVFLIKILMKDFLYQFSILEIFILQIFYEILIIIYYLKGLFRKSKW